jgi:DNA sulfur modification protein DndD
MIIKSVTLTNFQCYYGEVQFQFQDGLNLIIGDNGAGKSKLYDAFYWVLYDKVFDSINREEKVTGHKDVKGNLISDKARDLCDLGESVTTIVEMVVFNPKKEETYTLLRTYTIDKNNDGTWNEPNESKQTAIQSDKYNDSHPVHLTEIESLRKRILPDDVKPYMWFQGEQVDSLIDFKQNDTLTRAINVLSDISEFDYYKEVAIKALEVAEKEYRREERRVSTDSKKSDELYEQKDKIRINLERLELERTAAQEQLYKAKEGKDKLFGKMDDAQRIRDISSINDALKQRLKETDERHNKKKSEINKSLFSKYWLLKGTNNLVNDFDKQFETYTQNRQNKEAEQRAKNIVEQELQRVLLPKNVPEPVYMKQMLEAEKCLVCDREALKGSEAYEKIKDLLDRSLSHNQRSKPEAITKHDFSKEFKHLYQNSLNLQGNINQIDGQILETLNEINELEVKYKDIKEDLAKNDKELMNLVNASKINLTQSYDVSNEFNSHLNAIVEAEKKLTQNEGFVTKKKAELWGVDDELKKLVKGKIPKFLEEKVSVLTDFKEIAVSTRDRVFTRLILKLEEEANKHFLNMTAENKSVRGRIKLEKQEGSGNYMPKNLDGEGRALSSINDSNIILIKLAVIMAIISAKRSSPAAELYPLITDAPTSKFGDNYAVGFCRAASQVYSQSIVISKDFYNKPDLLDRIVKEIGSQLGSVYVIEPSLTEEEQRESRNELEVKITKKR